MHTYTTTLFLTAPKYKNFITVFFSKNWENHFLINKNHLEITDLQRNLNSFKRIVISTSFAFVAILQANYVIPLLL